MKLNEQDSNRMVFVSLGSGMTIDKYTETIRWRTPLKERIIPFSAVKSVRIGRRVAYDEYGVEDHTPYVLSIVTTGKQIVIDEADEMAGACKIYDLAHDIGKLIGKPFKDR